MAECFFSLEHIFIIKKVHIKWDVVISSFFIVDIINERDHTFMTSKKKEKGINFALPPPPVPLFLSVRMGSNWERPPPRLDVET